MPGDITGSDAGSADDLHTALRAYERDYIRTVLTQLGGDRRRTAARLGIGVSTLYRKLHELGLDSHEGAVTDNSSTASPQ